MVLFWFGLVWGRRWKENMPEKGNNTKWPRSKDVWETYSHPTWLEERRRREVERDRQRSGRALTQSKFMSATPTW